jgi:hypothetical protein
MEGTTRSRESARKIFEKQTADYIVKEKCKGNRLK